MPETLHSILVLDDEERVRELLLEYLSEFDEFNLSGAGSGEEALDLLRRQGPVELCVVDIRLPGMSGADFIEAASAAKLSKRFIVHTGSGEFTLSRTLLGLGLVKEDVFYKPVDAGEMLARIRLVLKQGRE